MPRLSPIDDASAPLRHRPWWTRSELPMDPSRTRCGRCRQPRAPQAHIEMSKALDGTLPGRLRERIAIAIDEQNG